MWLLSSPKGIFDEKVTFLVRKTGTKMLPCARVENAAAITFCVCVSVRYGFGCDFLFFTIIIELMTRRATQTTTTPTDEDNGGDGWFSPMTGYGTEGPRAKGLT